MEGDVMRGLLERYRNYVFLGEAGSGKTEIAINIAIAMMKETRKQVHFFDLDQTKPLFRARDAIIHMEHVGIHVHSQTQFQDIPSMTPGVIESLCAPARITFLDVGGGLAGARMIGQLSRHINTADTCVFFIINVYRPWSANAQSITKTMEDIMQACRVLDVRLISNPNLGPTTTREEILRGTAKLFELLGDQTDIDYICVTQELQESIGGLGRPMIPIRRYIRYPDMG